MASDSFGSIEYRLQQARNNAMVRSGAIAIKIENGRIIYSPIDEPLRKFYDIQTASLHVRHMTGMTGAFQHKRGNIAMGGPAFIRRASEDFMERWADSSGLRGEQVLATVHKFNTNFEMQSLHARYWEDESKLPLGLLLGDQEKAQYINMTRAGGKALDAGEVLDFFRQSQGWSFGVTEAGELPDKTLKRIRRLMAEQHFQGFIKPVTVSLIDAEATQDLGALEADLKAKGYSTKKIRAILEDTSKKASDGVIRVNRKFMSKTLGSYRQEFKRLETALASATDRPTMLSIRAEMDTIQSRIDELDEIIKSGQPRFVANVSIFGGHLDTSQITDRISQLNDEIEQLRGLPDSSSRQDMLLKMRKVKELRESLDKINKVKAWAVKGNLSYVPDAAEEARLDIRALTTDFGRNIDEIDMSKYADNYKSLITMSPFETSMQRINVGMLSAYPDIFDSSLLSELAEETLENLENDIKAIEQGHIPESLKAVIKSQKGSSNPNVARRAHALEQFINNKHLSLMDDPNLREQAIRMLVNENTFTKGDVVLPKMLMSDTWRGEIHALESVKSLDPRLERMSRGEIRFIKNFGWVTHDADAGILYPMLGGFDFDDAIYGNVRWVKDDAGNLSLRVIAMRDPLTRGELAVLKLNTDDDIIYEALGRSIKDSVKRDQAQKNFTDLAKYENKLRELESLRNPSTVDQADMRKLRGLIPKLREAYNANVESIFREMPDVMPAMRGFVGGYDLANYVGFDQGTFTRDGNKLKFHGGKVLRMGVNPRTGKEVLTYGYSGEDVLTRYMEMELPSKKSANWGKFITELADNEEDAARLTRSALGSLMGKLDVYDSATGGSLGSWANARMFYDHWYGNHAETMIDKGLSKNLMNLLFEQEPVIDIYTQLMSGVDDAAQLAADVTFLEDQMLSDIIRNAALYHERIGGGSIDPKLLEWKAKNDSLIITTLQEINEGRLERGLKELQLNELLMDKADKRATIQLVSEYAERITGIPERLGLGKELRYPVALESEFGKMVAASTRAEEDASMILAENRRIMGDLIEESKIFGAGSDELKNMYRASGHQFLQSLTDLFDVTASGERVAGERAYSAVIRIAQKISQGQVYGAQRGILSALHDIGSEGVPGFMETALMYAKSKSGLLPEDQILETLTERQIFNATETVTTRAMRAPFEEILKGTNVSFDFLERITEGAKFSKEGILSGSFQDELGKLKGAQIFVPEGAKFRGFVSPMTMLRMSDGEETSLGRLMHTYMQWDTPIAQKKTIADNLRGLYSQLFDMTATHIEDQPDVVLQRTMAHAIQMEAPGSAQAIRAREAVENAAAVSGNLQQKTGLMNFAREFMAKPNLRKPVIATAGILLAAALLRSVRRDHTLEDMQGPMLPGEETPYTGEVDRSMEATPPTMMPARPTMTGTRYVVRARGGQIKTDGLIGFINEITGTRQITSTTYDNSAHSYPSEEARMRVLSQYR